MTDFHPQRTPDMGDQVFPGANGLSVRGALRNGRPYRERHHGSWQPLKRYDMLLQWKFDVLR
jgi:hypothetical protein